MTPKLKWLDQEEIEDKMSIYNTGNGRLARMALGGLPLGIADLYLDKRKRSPDNMMDPYSGEADYNEDAQFSPGYERFANRDGGGTSNRYKNAYARAFGSPRLNLFGR